MKIGIERIALSAGTIALAGGLVASTYTSNGTWFQRAGVFGIVAAALAEYISLRPQIEQLAAFKAKIKRTGQRGLLEATEVLESGPDDPKTHRYSALLLSISTLVTGCGDPILGMI